MNDLAPFFAIGTFLVATIVLVIGPGRLIVPDPERFSALFRAPFDDRWPRGVQEEEPKRWRIELLDRRQRILDGPALPTATATARRARGRQGAGERGEARTDQALCHDDAA